MRFSLFIFFAPLIFASTGCALVLGLDNGNDVAEVADAEAGVEEAASDAAIPPVKDSGPTCAPNTGDCNGNPNDGCETMLNSPQHCGTCTNACGAFKMCTAGACCSGPNQACGAPGDCCSNKCDGNKCGK